MRLWVIAALIGWIASPAMAQVTVLFQDGVSPTSGYAGTRDLIVKEGLDEAWQPTVNYDSFGLGAGGAPDRMATLIRFDHAGIPAGSTVVAVRFVLYTWDLDGTPLPIYEATRPWVASAATFERYDATNPWEVPGALGATDRAATALALVPQGTEGPKTIPLGAAGAALVQEWVNGTKANNGFLRRERRAAASARGGSLDRDDRAAHHRHGHRDRRWPRSADAQLQPGRVELRREPARHHPDPVRPLGDPAVGDGDLRVDAVRSGRRRDDVFVSGVRVAPGLDRGRRDVAGVRGGQPLVRRRRQLDQRSRRDAARNAHRGRPGERPARPGGRRGGSGLDLWRAATGSG